ncbi:hypothetical protein F2P81_022813 [Scophthalmus maximus]|uniref:Uncharacterized protein n=1 Tax=Scophthalmus maximus TaxID=52904 RepID=A0A6A4S3M3_SCOMX|nr:hypothetical protein F2P81_022813 [Scophthalmus maximus]
MSTCSGVKRVKYNLTHFVCKDSEQFQMDEEEHGGSTSCSCARLVDYSCISVCGRFAHSTIVDLVHFLFDRLENFHQIYQNPKKSVLRLSRKKQVEVGVSYSTARKEKKKKKKEKKKKKKRKKRKKEKKATMKTVSSSDVLMRRQNL